MRGTNVDANVQRWPTCLSKGLCSCGGGGVLCLEGQRDSKATSVRRHLQVSHARDEQQTQCPAPRRPGCPHAPPGSPARHCPPPPGVCGPIWEDEAADPAREPKAPGPLNPPGPRA
eukprot:364743-Chlamydomonas_euryale.AAC.113